MKEIQGNTTGLKPSQRKRLETLYRRKVPRQTMAPSHFLRALTEISREIERQIGVLIDRKGQIEMVIVGDADKIFIPTLERQREGQGRFRGLRLIHTHLNNEPLSKDDLNDLTVLRLDVILAVGVGEDGLPRDVHYAHLLPENVEGKLWRVEGPVSPFTLEEEDFLDWIHSLEEEFARVTVEGSEVRIGNRALLVGVYPPDQQDVDARMDELHELARSAGLYVMTRVIQRREQPDHRYLLGQGKIESLVLRSMQLGVDILVFDTDLSPTQSRNIADMTDLKIIDRTQLILDIFAQHAHSRDGKIQVELAQLKYLLPRLNRLNKAMSRLTGGIGGRGPGETKLEINRRRARERISRLETLLSQVSQRRKLRRSRRLRSQIPIVSVVGYTNAGKSTLVNTLTHSDVYVEDRLFSTLDPVSRKLRFPEERELILTDTVGFIRDLPPELVAAFHATLEESADSDLLLHVVDIDDPSIEERIQAVHRILEQLELHEIPRLCVLNKVDLMDDPAEVELLCRRYDAIAISAQDPRSLAPLLSTIELLLWRAQQDDSFEVQPFSFLPVTQLEEHPDSVAPHPDLSPKDKRSS
ncbi:MAG: GTPase HflX [Myxococcales bacterium]|nr:GTPase HflX [Myxococcales bacterium]